LQLTGAKRLHIVVRGTCLITQGEMNVVRRVRSKPEVVGLLGVGLDNKDEHKRITRSEEMLLVGGSEETHARMQDVAIRFSQSLRDRGKTLREASVDEVADLLRDALD
jgi:hypothetical protein